MNGYDRIAAALGLSGDATKKALGAAVPALLAALGTKAASPVGARALFDAVSDADPDVFGLGPLHGFYGHGFVLGSLSGKRARRRRAPACRRGCRSKGPYATFGGFTGARRWASSHRLNSMRSI